MTVFLGSAMVETPPTRRSRGEASSAAVHSRVRIRTREWRAALAASPRLKRVGGVSTIPLPKNTVTAELYEVR